MSKNALTVWRASRGLLALCIVFGLCFGCKPAQDATGVVAPSKPLSEAESTLLTSIERQPPDKRAAYVREHMEEVMKFSAANKSFGDRMNALLKTGSN